MGDDTTSIVGVTEPIIRLLETKFSAATAIVTVAVNVPAGILVFELRVQVKLVGVGDA